MQKFKLCKTKQTGRLANAELTVLPAFAGLFMKAPCCVSLRVYAAHCLLHNDEAGCVSRVEQASVQLC